MASQFPGDHPQPVTPPPHGAGPDASGMIDRIKNLVTSPKTEWPRIDAAPMTERGIYMGWVLPLTAIPVIAKLIGTLAFPPHIFGVVVRTGVATAIMGAIVSYALAIASVFAMAWIVAALAPQFGGVNDRTQATKLIAFTSAPVWVAGIAYLLPMLGGLVTLVAGIYAIYILYLGLPVLMKSPPDKNVPYLLVTVVVAIVVFVGLALVASSLAVMFMPTPTIGTVTVS